MKTFARQLFAIALILTTGAWPAISRAQSKQAAKNQFLQGTWFLNQDLSDKPQGRGGDDQGRRGGPGNGAGRGSGRPGGGGFGRGRGGFGGGGQAGGPENMARMQEAMRDIMTPPDRLTIVQTDSMIIITTGDGRTTRLSPDGKSIKDENTGIERKTRWDAGKLVSEIDGLGQGKITETYSIDPERNQLHVAVTLPNVGARGARGSKDGNGTGEPRTINRVYDAGDASGAR